jgi:hypothetical protein
MVSILDEIHLGIKRILPVEKDRSFMAARAAGWYKSFNRRRAPAL